MSWNGSNSTTGGGAAGAGRPRGARRASGAGASWRRGLLAGLLVAIGGAAALWLVLRSDEPVVRERRAKPVAKAAIREVKPAVVTKAAPVAATDATKKGKRPAAATKTYVDERGVERYPGGARVPRKNPNRVTLPDRRAVKWAYDCEEEICELLQLEPGDTVVGDDYTYGPKFVADFRASLKTPIEIKPEDDWYQRQLKESVIEAKKDLEAALNRGEDISEVMSNTRKELRRLFEYKEDVEAQVRKLMHGSTDYTERDLQDLTAAANKMLEAKGIPPIKMPRLVLRRILKRNAAQQDAAEAE